LEQSTTIADKVKDFLEANFSKAIISQDEFRGQKSYYVKPETVVPICRAMFESTELDVRYLADITSLDWYGNEKESDGRFEVVYNLYSLSHQYRFFLKAKLEADDPTIPTLTTVFEGANWMEKEVFDMMGIKFEGHPNLTKILTPDELEGHPLRRDFPLTYEVPQFSWNKDDPPEVIK
jgi:NADH-quinone oxidoreductase subunit C